MVGNGAECLSIGDITVHFEGLAAVEGVSWTLRRDDVLGLIGPNGAGKTTIVNVISGFQHPARGKVVLDGEDITDWQPHRRSRHGLVRTFQAVRLFRGMSVIDNLAVAGVGTGLARGAAERRAYEILTWMQFEHRAMDPADSLPYGEERRIGIARALTMAPRYIMLDEPAAGLGDVECDELMQLIAAIPRQFHCGVLLIEHNMRLIMGACHRIHVLDSGRTIAEGSPAEIRADPAVVRAYLGTRSEQRRVRR
ncbi:MAG: ABC transporter ATP-binding protein [Alphaproteobacteria bacterium]|nr:ABC transporter ATP-binding protein [Alphaproteobacteria bacterium]